MKLHNRVLKMVLSAFFLALAYVMPFLTGQIPEVGAKLCPLHIPVLLCGLVCGSLYGCLCGVIGPVLASVITGMPGPAMLVSMVPELMAYGLVTGLMMKLVKTRNLYADLYVSLATAMVAGRIVGGIAKALFFTGTGEAFTLAIWASSYFVATLPGIVAHLIVIPLLVVTLMKARLIPNRYPKKVNA